jgi:signal transduction histidine kinase
MATQIRPLTDAARIAALEAEIAKLRRINTVLMDRVERSTDLQGNAFSLFENAIALEGKVRQRTADLERTLGALAASNAALAATRDAADEAQRRLRDAIESINEGFAIFDAEDRLVLCNQTYLGLWPNIADRIAPGVTFDEITRMVVEDGSTLGARIAPDRWMSERLTQHKVAAGGHVHALADGRWIQINELRTSEGGIVGVYTDITETKTETADIAAINAKLQREIDERLAVEAALREAKTVAEQANISKTRFLAAASHDLLQPLNAARLFVAALGDRRLAPPTRALVRQTGAALDSVEDLLEALLEISKLDAGAVVPEISAFRLDSMLHSMKAEFAAVARERGLAFDVEECGLWVRSDQRLLRRILQNFISNALRYTSIGSVRVACRRDGDQLRIEVIDTGPGIAPEHHAEIFVEFRRLEGHARDRGMGLGLAIVQRASRMLGHDLHLESRTGAGSTFGIDVPITHAHAAEDAATTSERRRGLSGRLVLVIDNEPSILAGMAAMLGGWGCRAIVATDETEALARVADEEWLPDMIVADYHLDGGALGDAAVTALRRDWGVKVPAVILTADRTPALRDQLLASGLSVLTKPVKPAQLRALLSRMTGG